MASKLTLLTCLLLLAGRSFAQLQDPTIDNIVKEETDHSQLRELAHDLFDRIGPRLVGTPQMEKAAEWAIAKYTGWGISCRMEKWGEWHGWERGISHLDMVYPRVKSLEGMQLAWSPGMGDKTITADLIILPDVQDSLAFEQWLPAVKGKFVLISMLQPTGRPDDNWQQFATPESFEKMKKERAETQEAWALRIKKTG